MGKKKLFVLLPDGVSLRNFAYTSFYKEGKAKGYDIVFWNNTSFDLESLGFTQINIRNQKLHRLTDILKAARTRIELSLYIQREEDPIYQGYIFPLSYKNLKARVKSVLIRWYGYRYGSEKGLNTLRDRMKRQEQKGSYYKYCTRILKEHQPDVVFCTSQRSVQTIAPILAAQDLDIPTAAFIFSWDNVPKATTLLEADYYFAWSELMQQELLHYNKYITEEQIIITGTPQFTPHYEQDRIKERAAFCKEIGVDPTAKFVCFSGDDYTTSPKDELYLRDVAQGARESTSRGAPCTIIFRRCPVDFSDRYDAVLREYIDVVVEVKPRWKKIGDAWNTILPTAEDVDLQVNLLAHSEGVINLGSSMVFDAIAHKKPCAYMNYNYLNDAVDYEPGVYVYDFVHFRSMPSKESVIWLDHPDIIADALEVMLQGAPKTIKAAQDWFNIINKQPATEASSRIWNGIKKICL